MFEYRIIKLPDLTFYIEKYNEWLKNGYEGEMVYLRRRSAERASYPEFARSVLVARVFYSDFSWNGFNEPGKAYISKYAVRRDYHLVLREKIMEVVGEIESNKKGLQYKVFIDSSPVLEKPLGFTAGFGFWGFNTLLTDFSLGSYFNLGGAFLDLETEERGSVFDGNPCVNCGRCVTACPQGAFVKPGVMDARKCTSYLTIEYKGVIPKDLATRMGKWLFGCDICQEVCPLNKKVPIQSVLNPLFESLVKPDIEFLLKLDEEGFKKIFFQTPVERIGYQRFLRNLIVVAYNTGEKEIFRKVMEKAKNVDSELVKNQIKELCGEWLQGRTA